MSLLTYDNYRVVISPYAMSIEDLRAIWVRDKTKSKEKAQKELSYIYFFCDPRSDFMYLTNLQERAEHIKKAEGFDPKWKPDKYLLKAMETYRNEICDDESILLLDDLVAGVNTIRLEVREFNLSEEKDKIKALTQYTQFIKNCPDMIESLQKCKKTIHAALNEKDVMRGKAEKHLCEDDTLMDGDTSYGNNMEEDFDYD